MKFTNLCMYFFLFILLFAIIYLGNLKFSTSKFDISNIYSTNQLYDNTSIRIAHEFGIIAIIGIIGIAIVYFIYKLSKISDKEYEEKYGKKRPESFVDLLITLFIIFIFFALLADSGYIFPRKPPKWRAQQNECYSNIRTIQSAVEMYNMDVSETDMIHELKDDTLKNLKNQGYLKSFPKCPTNRSIATYTSFGDIADEFLGFICCGTDPIAINGPLEGHGTIEGVKNYTELKEKLLKERLYQRNRR